MGSSNPSSLRDDHDTEPSVAGAPCDSDEVYTGIQEGRVDGMQVDDGNLMDDDKVISAVHAVSHGANEVLSSIPADDDDQTVVNFPIHLLDDHEDASSQELVDDEEDVITIVMKRQGPPSSKRR